MQNATVTFNPWGKANTNYEQRHQLPLNADQHIYFIHLFTFIFLLR